MREAVQAYAILYEIKPQWFCSDSSKITVGPLRAFCSDSSNLHLLHYLQLSIGVGLEFRAAATRSAAHGGGGLHEVLRTGAAACTKCFTRGRRLARSASHGRKGWHEVLRTGRRRARSASHGGGGLHEVLHSGAAACTKCFARPQQVA